jgi:hypothetical protein
MRLIYDSSTGKIRATFQGPTIFLDIQPKELTELDLDIEDNTDVSLSYIVAGSLTARPVQATTIDKITIIANGTDAITITNSPSGIFTAINSDTADTVSGAISGTDTFSTTIVGSYTITIVSWPYLDYKATITATEI